MAWSFTSVKLTVTKNKSPITSPMSGDCKNRSTLIMYKTSSVAFSEGNRLSHAISSLCDTNRNLSSNVAVPSYTRLHEKNKVTQDSNYR